MLFPRVHAIFSISSIVRTESMQYSLFSLFQHGAEDRVHAIFNRGLNPCFYVAGNEASSLPCHCWEDSDWHKHFIKKKKKMGPDDMVSK